jgi:hypothetical protein
LIFGLFVATIFSMAGRPKKTEGETRENVLRIRLTEEERAVIDRVAHDKALDTSSWARSVLVALARQLDKDEDP